MFRYALVWLQHGVVSCSTSRTMSECKMNSTSRVLQYTLVLLQSGVVSCSNARTMSECVAVYSSVVAEWCSELQYLTNYP